MLTCTALLYQKLIAEGVLRERSAESAPRRGVVSPVLIAEGVLRERSALPPVLPVVIYTAGSRGRRRRMWRS